MCHSDKPDQSTSEPVEAALALITRGQLHAACRHLEADQNPEAVSRDYADLVKILYRRRKDVAGMLACGNAAIKYQLNQSEQLRDRDPDLATRLRTSAKALAFNVAANCWPGWGDEGIVVEPAHIDEALKLANISLGLVEELKLGAHQPGNAHWLVGALELAAGSEDAALVAFARAHSSFLANGEHLEALLVDGYRALARRQSAKARGNIAIDLNEVISRLTQDGSDKAKFFADQLRTAERIMGGWQP